MTIPQEKGADPSKNPKNQPLVRKPPKHQGQKKLKNDKKKIKKGGQDLKQNPKLAPHPHE
jgi:hypothetical protein